MKKHYGLTLIEVLIASIILFMTLGLVAVVFQQNFATQLQSVKYINSLADYNTIQANIRYELEQKKVKGDITTVNNKYSWKAEVISAAPEIRGFSPETGAKETGAGFLVLYNITISSESAITYDFRQTIWQISVD
ncbi:prepilin-type N-terminal cleavage/methylation domain-containing protein [Rheinheimera sp. MMS21-TC3]|uniref:prepilin-type N-terminal cleavage/methylation domain-containing protein n=1 Tax=Rheinheimera sp. MMS21-TC3 TaxID=3072790 RepID=UPI0028C484C9|nr:prepilin-type N-terminal cleavage/methylation domain-containing protein [Rheinheimera sp. MMS21-TC3]WNO61662.1 prepilin-type N-terminal cleavage/methylation domain-containing protein [Rheinheimera sp. MMS21-TC3]